MKRFIFSILVLCAGFQIGLHAQSRLHPISRYASSSNRYLERVSNLLSNDGRFRDFAFEIRPSFSGETGCYYNHEDSTLVLRVAQKNIYYFDLHAKEGKKKKKAEDVDIIEYRCPISPGATTSFRRLFYAAVFSSSYFSKRRGNDGTTYQLFTLGGYTAECWSPGDNDSNCGKLVAILESLTEAIKSNDPQAIDNLIPTVEQLTRSFEELFPEDVKLNADINIDKYDVY